MKFGLSLRVWSNEFKPCSMHLQQVVKDLVYEVVYNSTDCDVAVIWSYYGTAECLRAKTIWDEFKRVNKPVIVLEVGALDRNNLWKVEPTVSTEMLLVPVGMIASPANHWALS